MGPLLGGGHERKQNQAGIEIRSIAGRKPVYRLPLYLDDFERAEDQGGDYECGSLFPGSTPVEQFYFRNLSFSAGAALGQNLYLIVGLQGINHGNNHQEKCGG